MGKSRPHPPVKIIIACTRRSGFDTAQVHGILEEKLSPIEAVSDIYDFSSFTGYYTAEMGFPLEKDLIVFSRPEDPGILPALKGWTNEVEQRFSISGKRALNLDPGYICDARLVLATTKNYTHRLYLNSGIYGDVHLVYRNHTFNPQPWTYPDYKQPAVIAFLNAVREKYVAELNRAAG